MEPLFTSRSSAVASLTFDVFVRENVWMLGLGVIICAASAIVYPDLYNVFYTCILFAGPKKDPAHLGTAIAR